MPCSRFKKIVVAGLGGDSGKSLFAIGLIGALRKRGIAVAPFKKGPDFIDAAWLGRAAAREGRNLDTYLMPKRAILARLSALPEGDVAVVEGNRGLFDGMTATGEHSTAALARLIDAPVLLVVDVTKVTRTVAALVKGCALLEPGLHLGGVVLNRVATRRQEAVIREAVETETGIPVVGAVYRQKKSLLPSRHLGLLTAIEHPDVARALETATEMVEEGTDIEAILALAGQADDPVRSVHCDSRLNTGHHGSVEGDREQDPKDEKNEMDLVGGAAVRGRALRIAVLKDRAFSFYYPENLEALEALGATLVYVSPIADSRFPDDVDGLYAGGGFPEVYAEALAENETFRGSLLARIESGLPVFAECGGLMFLARSLSVDGRSFPMVGALPIDVAQRRHPKGHGYVSGRIDGDTPFFPTGASFRGHEFHYSEIVGDTGHLATVAALDRGVGVGNGRDGIVTRNVTAFYTHFHALGERAWAAGFVAAVSRSHQL